MEGINGGHGGQAFLPRGRKCLHKEASKQKVQLEQSRYAKSVGSTR